MFAPIIVSSNKKPASEWKWQSSGIGAQRKEERFFEPVEKVLWEFKNIHRVDIDDIDTRTWEGKRLRC
jgi:hypothetical protein